MDDKDCKPPAAKKARVVSPAKDSAVGSAAGNNIGAHILPPECFGHALSFLPYSDVRSASRTGRYLAFQAAREVDTINIYSPLEMNARAGFKRFPNVTQVNIFCLQFIHGHTVNRWAIPQDQLPPDLPPSPISKLAADCIVPFLLSFPHLEGAFVGGVVEEFDHRFNRVITKECPVRVYDGFDFNESYNDIMEALIKSFCIAFEVGALPPDLKLRGLLNKADEMHDVAMPFICPGMRRARASFESAVDEGSCEFCQNICKHFPIAAVCSAIGLPLAYLRMRNNCCIAERTQLDILSKRRGWKEYTSQSYAPLEMVLRRSFSNTNYKDYTTVGGIPLLKFGGFLRFRRIPHDIFSLKQSYEDDGPDCERLISEMISKYGFKPETIPSQRLAQIIAATEYGTLYQDAMDTFAEVFVDAKTLQVLSSFGFKVDNLMEFDKDRLPHFTPRTTLELISDDIIMERIRCGSSY